jgi:tRNA-2-methylthio-N6-dimethylallyladenosine synthase
MEVLVEGPSKKNQNRLSGRTRCNKLVMFDGDERHQRQLLPVRILSSSGFTYYGDPVIHD